MLVQLPQGSAEAARASSSSELSSFEEGLRRDLASAPVVHYDPVLGGWRKRAFDLVVTLAFAPVWLPALLVATAWAKIRQSGDVFQTEELVGYGGRTFQRHLLRLETPPTAATVPDPIPADASVPANDLCEIAENAEARRAKWRRLLESLPQVFNVLQGSMSLVGAEPVSQDAIEGLKTGRRHYLSARPGVFDIARLVHPEHRDGRFKAYVLSWSVITDVLLIWDGVRCFYNSGELWRPGLNLTKIKRTPIVVRRRTAP